MLNFSKIAVTLELLAISFICYAQVPEVEWDIELGNPSSGDYGRGAFQTDDGGYIVGGNSNSYSGGYMDFVLFKLDEFGDTVWSNSYGTDDYQESANCFRLMDDGTYMYCGKTNIDSDGLQGYLVSINPDGTQNYTHTFGDASIGETATCFAAIDTISYAAMTSFWYDGDYGYDLKLYYLQPGVSSDWGYHFLNPLVADYPTSIQVDLDGGYIVTGSSQDCEDFDVQLLMLKIASDGITYQWSLIGGSNDEHGYWVIETEDGGYLATGYQKRDDDYTKDVYIVKTDSECQLQWSKAYGFGYMDEGRYCLQTADGGYVIGATCKAYDSFDFWLLRLDANGDTLWTKVVEKDDTDESLYTVDICDDGGYILCGNSSDPGGDCQMYAVKLDAGTSVDDDNVNLPEKTALLQNYPNPFNANTLIEFRLPSEQHVNLCVYDILGREVTTLLDMTCQAGTHSVVFDADEIPSGVYFYRIKTDEYTQTRQMSLIK